MPQDDRGTYKDDQIGQVDNFTADDVSFIDFNLEFDEISFRINIGSFSVEIPAVDMPHVFGRGRIFFIAGFCRVGINKMRVEELK